jgi:aminopeptidase N
MRFKVVLTFVLLAVSGLATAQTQVQPPTRAYSVTSYNLLMDWRNVFNHQTQVFSGRNVIQVVLGDTTSAIVLDASEMTIDSVSVNGQSVPTPAVIGDTISIPLPLADRSAGTPVTLSVSYTHTIDTIDPQSGMFYYPKGTSSNNSVTTPEDAAYTMSEPDGARKWMPCNDEPYNKTNASISVIVPSGYSAQSNGTLQSADTNKSDASVTFHWKSDQPIVTYLMAAYASKWVVWSDYYHRLSNPNDSVAVTYYAWPSDFNVQDTLHDSLNAHYAFRNTPKMIENDSRLFGEYPFSQYSQVPLDPFYFGGMEHQTITALDRGILFGTEESVIAHELFHQWFGDKTTCETWADIWLNEGFATYGEMLWAEAAHGTTAYHNYARSVAAGFFSSNLLAPTYDPPVDQMFGWPYVAVVYYKPGCVLHMMRRMLNNDTMFFNTIRDYSAQFAYTTANTFQFRDFVAARDNAVAPMDLKDFINQWIFQPDWPIYQIRWAAFGDTLRVQVDQTQDSTDHYVMPLRFKAINQKDTMDIVFMNNKRSQAFTTILSKPAQRLIFDTDAVVISIDTVIHDQNLAVNSDVPASAPLEANLSNGVVKLSYGSIVSEDAAIRLTDVLGRTIVDERLSIGSDRTILPYSDFSSGDYFVTLTDGRNDQTAKFHIEK